MHSAYRNETCPNCKKVQATRPDVWVPKIGWHRKCVVCGTRVTEIRAVLTAPSGVGRFIFHLNAPLTGNNRI